MSYQINVYNPDEWELYFDSTFYLDKPKKCQALKKWAEDSGADIVSNLCYFNFLSSKENPGYTIQYLRIPRLGGDCGYGSNSTVERLVLPNGDTVSGWATDRLPAVRNNKLISSKGTSIRAHNAIGETTDGRFFTVQNRYNTEAQVARYAINFLEKYYGTSIRLMLWEDGGGSVGTYCRRSGAMYAPMKEGTYGRAVCSVFCAKKKPQLKLSRTLSKGSRGDDVKILQMMIAAEADGIFGSGTRKKVIEVQKRLGLVADGIAGPKTLSALGL
jgi:Putative peptidoglycan-binding domain-containing protein